MSPEALEPKLTAYDLKVLRSIPDGEFVTIWDLGEAHEVVLDLNTLLPELNGLERFGYVGKSFSRRRGRSVYWRTRKGHEAIR